MNLGAPSPSVLVGKTAPGAGTGLLIPPPVEEEVGEQSEGGDGIEEGVRLRLEFQDEAPIEGSR